MSQEYRTAFVRAVYGALLLGASGALAMWQINDGLKEIVTAGLTPAIAHLLVRGGFEGRVDTNRKHNET